MTEPKTLARPYAAAAYQFAKQHHQVDAWVLMLKNLRALVLSEQVQKMLDTPGLDVAKFLAIVQAFSQKALDVHGVNFLKLLIANQRLALAPIILELFEALKAEADHVVAVDVTTAISLNAAEQSALVEDIIKHLKHKVSPTFHVDDAIIAGAVVRVGDAYVLDGSLKTQLARLKTKF